MASGFDADVAARLRAFVATRYLPDRRRPLADDEPLISSGIVDSMGLVDLTLFVEEELGTYLRPDEFGAGRVDTLADLVAAVARRR